MSFTYLASPYSHPDAEVRIHRFMGACRAAAYLMRQGEAVFCPIAHSHPIEYHCFEQPENGEFWKAQDLPLLRAASKLVVLMLDGWLQSSGIRWEIAEAERLGLPVEYLDPEMVL
jgi:hypothetical protein